MSKIEKTFYQCDICKCKSEDKNFIKQNITVPVKQYDCEGRSYTEGIAKLDLCEYCFHVFWNISQEKFAEVSNCCGEIDVEKICYDE